MVKSTLNGEPLSGIPSVVVRCVGYEIKCTAMNETVVCCQH